MIAIYKTILKSTGKVVYVGQTKRLEILGKYYFGGGKNITKYTRPQQREMFVSEIITTTENQQEANEFEHHYIDFYNTLEVDGGLNRANGGLGNTKIVLQYTKEGTFVAEYPSIAEAARKTGIGYRSISGCCLGVYKAAGVYVWKYKDIL